MGSLALKSFSFLWSIWQCHPAQHYRIENKQLKKEFLTSSETVSNINCSTVVSILLDFLQTQGVIFYTVSLFECLLLVRFWNEICLSILFYYIFHLLQPCYRNIYIYFLQCLVAEVRWLHYSQWWSSRNTGNQQNSETLNHHNDESWTRTQHWTDQCYVLISEE